MKKSEIKKVLRENTMGLDEKIAPSRHIQHAKSAKSGEGDVEDKHKKIANLLSNDLVNHAALSRGMTGEEWTDNSEATNRSKFRKKLNRMQNDEGGTYEFNDDELAQVQKMMMNFASTINHSIGREGK